MLNAGKVDEAMQPDAGLKKAAPRAYAKLHVFQLRSHGVNSVGGPYFRAARGFGIDQLFRVIHPGIALRSHQYDVGHGASKPRFYHWIEQKYCHAGDSSLVCEEGHLYLF